MKIISYTHRKEIVFPTGIIVPYNASGAAPSGWSLFTTANGKYLSVFDTSGDLGYTVGAHATVGINMDSSMTIGVADATGTIKYWTDSQGQHAGTYTLPSMKDMLVNTTATGDLIYYNPTQHYADGEHKHKLTCTPTIGYDELQLIKAASPQYSLPQNSLLLIDSSTDFSSYGLSQPFGAGNSNLLKSNTTPASAATSHTLTNATGGAHDHNWNVDMDENPLDARYEDSAGGAQDVIQSGNASSYNHTHNSGIVTGSIMTPNMKRFYLSAWTNASSSFKGHSKVIAMWEDPDNLPSGWTICDGTNGTKNLQKYFIILREKTSGGLYEGDNTIAITGTLATENWNHTHLHAGKAGADATVYGAHIASGTTNARHVHDAEFNYTDIASFLPAHYSLVFVQKT